MSSPAAVKFAGETESVRRELERVLASRELRNSLQLQKLLRYLIEETLAGRAEEIKEYSVGLAVFQRGPDFDPRLDSIVRVQVSILRKKLEAFYTSEPPGTGPRIQIPRGAYVPSWEIVDIIQKPAESVPPRREALQRLVWFGAGAAIGAGAVAVARREPTPPYAAPAIWGPLLRPGVETIVSYGVPLFFTAKDGLYLRDVQTNRQEEAATGRLARIGKLLDTPIRPQEDVYTGVGEAAGVQMISAFLEAQRVRTMVANSHYLGPKDLLGKNLVVVSSLRFQTLLDSLRLPHAFEFDSEGPGSLRNPRPLPGESAVYPRAGGPPERTVSFARISIWPSSSPEQRMMIVSGRETWSTEAAVRFLIGEQAQRKLQQRIDADPTEGPRGVKSEHLEIVVEAEGMNNRATRVDYLTHRYLKVPLPLRFR